MTRSTSHSPYRATASRQAAGSGSIPSPTRYGAAAAGTANAATSSATVSPAPTSTHFSRCRSTTWARATRQRATSEATDTAKLAEHQQDHEQGQRQPGHGVDAHRVGRAGDVERLVHLVVRRQRPRDGDRGGRSPHRARGPRATGPGSGCPSGSSCSRRVGTAT